MYIQPQTYRELTNMMEQGILKPIYRTEDTPKDIETIKTDIHGEIIGYDYRPSRQWQKDLDYTVDHKQDTDLGLYMDVYLATIIEQSIEPYGWIF